MLVYKYIDQFGLNVLRERRVKVSRAEALNDPFELAPQIDPSKITVEHVMRYLSRNLAIDQYYRDQGARLGFTNKKRFKRFILGRRSLREQAERLMSTIPQNVEQVRQNFAAMFSERWRLFCVSKIKDSLLMWAHYADEHKGMVIEFDTDQIPFSKLGKEWVVDVTYPESNSRPVFDFIPGAGRPNFIKSLMTVVGTKSSDWKYEQELRMVVPRVLAKTEPAPAPQAPLEFLRFAPAALRAVYLGCRCPEALKSAVMEALKPDDLHHVEVLQAALSKTRYQLEFTQIRAAAPPGTVSR